ncbi:MAG: ABC transporter ATP-binding protein [Flavobacteriales bacterium]|nr:ABC transporter ATP-binding protein [Flavobacteriales bacterium]
MNQLLAIEGLIVGHPGVVLVKDVSFTLKAGEVAAIVGVNGSGKSTLLRTVLGLYPPLAGSITIMDEDLASLSVKARSRSIGAVLTGRPRIGAIDVRTVVALGRHPWTGHMGRLSAVDHERVENALTSTGTHDLANRTFDSLSDGEAQKVQLARAVAQDTPVLVLDEPTAHLDVVNRVVLVTLLHEIARSLQRGVLLSTHDLATAMDLCDRILVIHDRTLWSGTPSEARASGILSRAFAADGLRFDPSTSTLRGTSP